MSTSAQPYPGPAHQCINVSCGCNDLITAGPCGEWCSAHTTEAADVARGKATPEACGCGHETCRRNRSARGTAERGLS
jgi:hypothetical protein